MQLVDGKVFENEDLGMEEKIMNKIDWKRKLTSRKFWAAVVGFITPIMIAAGAGDNEITQVAAIVMGGATLIAYIIGEGLVDSASTDLVIDTEITADDAAETDEK